MKAKLVLYCLTGFGDQYSNILTAYKAYVDLTKVGYDVELFWMVKNLYYSSDLPLDYIFDFSLFYNNGVKINYIKNENEISKNLKFLPTNQNAIKIFVSEICSNLINYELPVFDYFGFHKNSFSSYNPKNLPNFQHQFVSNDVLTIANEFVSQDKIKAVHIRCGDDYNKSEYNVVFEDDFFKERVKSACDFIESYPNEDIMICSSNKNVRKYFTNNFKNTFYNNFNSDLDLHNSYNNSYDEKTNIIHAQQIASEMVLLSKCDKIFTIGRNLSNFLTYGVAHNKYYKDWQTKIKNLIIN